MRKRLKDIVGTAAYHVSISTFHAFADRVIKENPDEFPHIIGSVHVSDVEQIALVEQIIKETTLEFLKPSGDPLYYVRAVQHAISELKREGVSVEEYRDLVERSEKEFRARDDLYHEKGAHKGKMKGVYKDLEKQIAKNRELSVLYDAYEQHMRSMKRYDFNDMIMEVLRALRSNEDLLLRLQEEYQYILVDEHQDTNNAQNKILELLASHFAPRPNLFVVGDEKQSIFRFQGASLENFYYFKHLYPEAKLITLSENYRSSQSILDSAHRLFPNNVALQARATHTNKPIDVYAWRESYMQDRFIAEEISRLCESGVPAHEIAVLYRDNRDSASCARALHARGIPFRIESDEDLFSSRTVRTLITILNTINNFGDERALAEYLHLNMFTIEPLDIFKVIRSAHMKKTSSLYDVIHNPKQLASIGLDSTEEILRAGTLLSHWVKQSHNMNLLDCIEQVFRESGLLASILAAPDAQEKLDSIDSFWHEIQGIVAHKPEARLRDLFEYLETITAHQVRIKKKSLGGREGFVRLMTAHRSKGLEFEYVYIINVRDGIWGNRHVRDTLKLLPEVYALFAHKDAVAGDDNADERRLFYVALTRAKKQVVISYARYNQDGKEQLPSEFISEIDDALVSIVDVSEREQDFEAKRGWIDARPSHIQGSLHDKAFVTDIFTKQGLSVSALNNYLSCPWKYFYRNLVRLPEPKQPHLLFGTAMHSALEYLFNKVRFGEILSQTQFITFFKTQLNTFPFESDELAVYEQRGTEALAGWYEEYHTRWITDTKTEFAIRGIDLTPTVSINGKLDKIEFLSASEVNVVDYKTGKPKTRNYILGNTKDSEGDYWRQLVFYKLLLNLYKDGVYDMVSAELDFLEPDKKSGAYRKEKFTVSDDDVADLKETIMRVADEITSLSFWDQRCNKDDCEYCALRELQHK